VEDRALTKKIEVLHSESKGRYGSPRVHQALAKQGICVGKKRVERLMRDAHLIGRAATLYRRVPGLGRFFSRYSNLRMSTPAPTGIDQQWVADVTYIRVAGEWQFLAVVMDVYSRRVIGWSLSPSRTVELTLRALRHALRVRSPGPDLIFHSDRGSEYAAYSFQSELAKHGIQASMSAALVAVRIMRIWSHFFIRQRPS